MKKYFLFVSILFLSLTGLACGSLDMSVSDTNVTLGSSVISNTITISRSNTATSCSYYVTFDAGSGSSYVNRKVLMGSDSLDYNIYRDSLLSSILYNYPDSASSSNFVIGGFPAGGGAINTHTIYFSLLPYSGSPPSGRYQDSVSSSLYMGTLGSGTLQRSRNIRSRFDMPKVTNISLVSTGSAYNQGDTTETLNFGALAQGQSLTMDVIVTYNAGYQITMSSSNNGSLKHSTLLQFVPYSLTVNSSVVNLSTSSSSPVIVSTGTGTNSNGLRVPVSVTIGALGTAAPGSYTDVIQMVVTSTH